jgi:hypothetical protein
MFLLILLPCINEKKILTVLILPLMFSCSKTFHSCADHLAINFNEDAEKDDGSCLYSTLTFYADSAQSHINNNFLT